MKVPALVSLAVIVALQSFAQIEKPAPSFEVVSVKPVQDPGQGLPAGFSMSPHRSPGRISWVTNSTLLLRYAYGLPDWQIVRTDKNNESLLRYRCHNGPFSGNRESGSCAASETPGGPVQAHFSPGDQRGSGVRPGRGKKRAQDQGCRPRRNTLHAAVFCRQVAGPTSKDLFRSRKRVRWHVGAHWPWSLNGAISRTTFRHTGRTRDRPDRHDGELLFWF